MLTMKTAGPADLRHKQGGLGVSAHSRLTLFQMNTKITIDSQKALERIGRIKSVMKNLSGFHKKHTRPRLFKRADEVFASRGEGSWKPLHPITIAKKGHSKILIDTGRLKKSYTGGTEGIVRIEKNTITYGSKVPYARYHERGEGVPKRSVTEHVNSRKFKGRITRDLNTYLQEKTKGR